MSELPKWVESVVTIAMTGGGAAATTLLGSWKSIKSRLDTLETKVGSDDPANRTGLLQQVFEMRTQVRQMRVLIESWDETPPEWVKRVARPRSVSVNLDETAAFVEEKLAPTMLSINRRINKLEQSGPGLMSAVSREDYERDSQARAEELRKIQQQLAEANGLLRGVMAALGYVDSPHGPRTK